MSKAHVWDASTVATLDAIRTRYEAHGKTLTVVGANADTAERLERLAGKLGAGH